MTQSPQGTLRVEISTHKFIGYDDTVWVYLKEYNNNADYLHIIGVREFRGKPPSNLAPITLQLAPGDYWLELMSPDRRKPHLWPPFSLAICGDRPGLILGGGWRARL